MAALAYRPDPVGVDLEILGAELTAAPAKQLADDHGRAVDVRDRPARVMVRKVFG
jgi:hypothetical protein